MMLSVAGNYKIPILYLVDRTRDGQTYVGRNIKAMQEGQAIFTMQASFKREEKDPFSHQFKMPDVPPPEQCVDLDKLLIKAIGLKFYFYFVCRKIMYMDMSVDA